MKFCFLIIMFCLLKAPIQAQGNKAVKIWYLSDSSIIDWSNANYPVSKKAAPIYTEEGTGSICDSAGNLLYYCNAQNLYNSNHVKLNNGFGLMGDQSTTQGTLILKHPESNLFHLFTNRGYGDSGGLYLTTWYRSSDTAIFVEKAIRIFYNTGEGINAVNHQNGRDIWIITHDNNSDLFYFQLLNIHGLNPCVKRIQSGPVLNDKMAANNIWLAPKGDMLGFEGLFFNDHFLIKFNNQTSELSSGISLPYNSNHAMAFSANGDYFYSWGDGTDLIFRRSLKIWNTTSIINSRENIATLKTSNTLRWPRLGFNDMIIFPRYNKGFFSVIKCSGDSLQNIKYIDTGIKLVDSKCTNGNFNTNQSYFYTPAINYKYKQNCNTNGFEFMGVDTFAATAYNWRITKGNNAFNYITKNINHLFNDTGIWQVKYVASNGARIDSVTKEIEIFPILKPGFLGKDIGYCGNPFPITIQGPTGMNCYTWKKPKGIETYIDHIKADTAGIYILETCNPVFCTYIDTIKVYEKAAPDATIIMRKGDSLFVSNAENGVQYQWYKGNVFTGKTGIGFKLLDTAWYKVQGVVPVNCYSGFDSVNVTTLNSNILQLPSISIQPNPNNGKFIIKSSQVMREIEIVGITGNAIYEINLPKYSFEIELQLNVNAGIYFVKINEGNWQKIIVDN